MSGGGAEEKSAGIRAELDRRYLVAMKARDGRTADTIRAVRARATEEQKKEGGTTVEGDALYLQVIERYVKQLEKALPEFDNAGGSGAVTAAAYRVEIGFLRQFLPTKLGPDQTKELVTKAIAALGVTDKRQLGRVMGALMKDHKDELDAQLARELIEAALG